MARKKRSDAKLAKLPPHQRETLIRWLVDENLSYEVVQERLEMDYSVRVGIGTLSNFYATECFSLRSSEAKAFAEQVEKELLTSEPTFDRATLALIKQKAFERAYARNGNITELAKLAGMIGGAAKLALKREQLEFSREKFRAQIMTDVEKGLEALNKELLGNPEALALFERMKALVLKTVEGKS